MDDPCASRSFVTLYDAWLGYEQSMQTAMTSKKADATLAQVQTALVRYTLPAWGFPLPKGQRLTREEREQGLEFLKQVQLKQLQDAPKLQDALFEQLQVAGNSRRNYRWALNNFIAWCKEQPGSSSVAWSDIKRSTPRQRERKRSGTHVRLTNRKARQSYRLAVEQLTPTLKQELETFYQFLTQPFPTARLSSPVSAATAQQHQQQLLRIFGWLHQVRAIPLEDLSFHCLIEFVPIPPRLHHSDAHPQDQVAARKTVELTQSYLEWLRGKQPESSLLSSEGIQSPHTELKVLDTLLAVAKFVYWQEKQPNLGNIEVEFPTVASLRQLRIQAGEKVKSHQPVSDRSKQVLEWTEFLEFGEGLRSECAPRFLQSTQSQQGGTTLGPLRTPSAIALSYQRFLLFALLTYLSPERPTVLRTLKISALLQSDGKVENSISSAGEGSLYREGNQWWVHLPVSRKRGQEPRRLLAIPNLQYADGRCFHQYLEEWLLVYSYEDDKGMSWEVPGLRSCFNPQHAYLFTMKNGQPYHSLPAFSRLLSNPTYRITGKIVNLQSFRQMIITFPKPDTLKAELENLGHSVGLN
ncbi:MULTISPECIES: hypothetical protein [Trichocoleus]|uniref:Core-binding (CB) domain-containing protein n=1 Tax=Trichocoleus desertorum GB2-A4 TaxID=2933944 RepID=A0ABV0JGU1_9CYAN|nr:hypothetical protein [Trichocoleus sp. FACHB-46]MBD1865572.1 hypothetical protein [Trichocoleus sp. FACHB-46]